MNYSVFKIIGRQRIREGAYSKLGDAVKKAKESLNEKNIFGC
jgi:hypothetical protein